MIINRLAGNSNDIGSRSQVLGRIWAANDVASMDYIPRPYPGMVTDIRPLKQYSIYLRDDLKWGELAMGGQKVVQLPIYPAGMLLEPFVKVLADALRKSLDIALEGSPTVGTAVLSSSSRGPLG